MSKDALDGAINAAAVAKANLEVAKKQYELTKAGAWIYDIRNQERTAARTGKGLCVLQRAARQVYPASPAGWHRALHQHNRRELCIPAGIL